MTHCLPSPASPETIHSLLRIINFRKSPSSPILYEIQHRDMNGMMEICWTPINQLYNHMDKVAKYEMGLLNKTDTDNKMTLEDGKNSGEESSQKSGKKFSIVKIEKMDKFDDKYEVDMMNNEHKKMMTFILTSQQLKRSFCKEFICFLEQQLFYHA